MPTVTLFRRFLAEQQFLLITTILPNPFYVQPTVVNCKSYNISIIIYSAVRTVVHNNVTAACRTSGPGRLDAGLNLLIARSRAAPRSLASTLLLKLLCWPYGFQFVRINGLVCEAKSSFFLRVLALIRLGNFYFLR